VEFAAAYRQQAWLSASDGRKSQGNKGFVARSASALCWQNCPFA